MTKLRIRFEPSGFEVDADPGETIMDITDANPEADIPYSCRTATCGTCRVRVVEGGASLMPADIDEIEVLEIFGDTPDRVRLCCQAQVAPSDARRLTLEVCDD
ncbi:MAG: 2Fe-2S iron-sulfur cluster-binding protein [Polyangiales bacterium]